MKSLLFELEYIQCSSILTAEDFQRAYETIAAYRVQGPYSIETLDAAEKLVREQEKKQ